MEKCEPGNPPSRVRPDEALATLAQILPRLWVEVDKPFFSVREKPAKWAELLPSSRERLVNVVLLTIRWRGVFFLLIVKRNAPMADKSGDLVQRQAGHAHP